MFSQTLWFLGLPAIFRDTTCIWIDFLLFISIRSEGLKAGYIAELNMLTAKLEEPKGSLEAFYAKRHEDKAIEKNAELQKEFQALIEKADQVVSGFNHAIKPIQKAVVPWINFLETNHAWAPWGYLPSRLRHLRKQRPRRKRIPHLQWNRKLNRQCDHPKGGLKFWVGYGHSQSAKM